LIAEDDLDLGPLCRHAPFLSEVVAAFSEDIDLLQLSVLEDPSTTLIPVYRRPEPVVVREQTYRGTGLYLIRRTMIRQILVALLVDVDASVPTVRYDPEWSYRAEQLLYQHCVVHSCTLPLGIPRQLHPSRALALHRIQQEADRSAYTTALGETPITTPLGNTGARYLLITSAGDTHPGFAEREWRGTPTATPDFDLIIVYYGDTDAVFDQYQAIATVAIRRKGLQYQNAHFVYWTFREAIEAAQYDYIMVLDDDLSFTNGENQSSSSALRHFLGVCSDRRPRLAHPSCSIRHDPRLHQPSWWIPYTGHQAPTDTNGVHWSPHGEMNCLAFRGDFFRYVMRLLPYRGEIFSWGYDLWLAYLLRAQSPTDLNPILIVDSVEYINATTVMKGCLTRTINDAAPQEQTKWEAYRDHHLVHREWLPTVVHDLDRHPGRVQPVLTRYSVYGFGIEKVVSILAVLSSLSYVPWHQIQDTDGTVLRIIVVATSCELLPAQTTLGLGRRAHRLCVPYTELCSDQIGFRRRVLYASSQTPPVGAYPVPTR
jgi:hypothetical protein